MQNKTIEPLVSLLIVMAVFCVCLLVILQSEQVLNKQLTASVFQPSPRQDEQEGAKLLTARAKEQLQIMVSTACRRSAYNAFLTSWNQECEKLDLEDKCSLPRAIADQLKKEYQDSSQECQK